MTAVGIRENARVVAALGGRAIMQALRRPQFLSPIVLFPSLFLAVNTGGAGSATHIPGFPRVHGFLDFELAGAMLQSSMLAAVSGGIALALDFENGFVDRLFAAPVSRFALVLGRFLGNAALGVLTAAWFVAVGLIFGAHFEAGAPGVALLFVLTPLTAMAFGGLGVALAIKSGRASVAQGVFPIVFVIIFLSSTFFPRNLLLEPAHSIADWNPMSFIVEGLRDPIVSGISLAALGKCLASIALVTAISWALIVWALRSRVRRG